MVESRIKIGGTYLHYKQKKYRVLGVARHSETLEELVIYECLYENPAGQLWVRPLDLFIGRTSADEPRFRLLDE